MPSFSNWSLLNRLTVGVVLLSTMGVVASDVAAQSLLRSYLTQEVDKELLSVAGGSIPRLDRAGIESDEVEIELTYRFPSGENIVGWRMPSANVKLRTVANVPRLAGGS
jgi:hypothetical protein